MAFEIFIERVAHATNETDSNLLKVEGLPISRQHCAARRARPPRYFKPDDRRFIKAPSPWPLVKIYAELFRQTWEYAE
jgi:hypothetical protein